MSPNKDKNYFTRQNEDINFDSFYKIITTPLWLNRSHPDIERNWKWGLPFIIMHSIFFLVFFFLMYSTIFKDLKSGDVTQACANGTLGVVFFVVSFKYFIMVYYQTIIKKMIDKVNADFQIAKSYSKHEQQLLTHFAHRSKFIVYLWLCMTIVTCSMFLVKAFGLMIYYAIIDEFKFVPFYDLNYPDAIDEKKNTLTVFCLLFILFVYYDMYASFMYLGFVPLGPVFMIHACGQLELAKDRILRVFQEENSPVDIENKLKDIGKLLQSVYSFVEDIKTSFKVMYEMTLKATAVIIPITIYQVLHSLNTGEVRIEFITIIVGAVALSSTPCYYSDMLMESGEGMRLAIYSCSWEKRFYKKTRSLLLLLLLRTTRSIAIRTMFRDLCLDALTDVYHQSYAIFNVLNAVWD